MSQPAWAEPPKRLTKADEAYQTIQCMIVTLELAPGTVIDERAFSEHLGIGRTPLREAVQRLVEQRLIISSRHRQAHVAPLEVGDLQSIYEFRITLEPMSARLAAERAEEADLQDLQAIASGYEGIAGELDIKEAIQIDYEFHSRLVGVTRNPYLIDAVDRLNFHSQRLWFLSLRQLDTLESIIEEHEAIFGALRERKGGDAERHMLAHIEQFRERMKTLFF